MIFGIHKFIYYAVGDWTGQNFARNRNRLDLGNGLYFLEESEQCVDQIGEADLVGEADLSCGFDEKLCFKPNESRSYVAGQFWTRSRSVEYVTIPSKNGPFGKWRRFYVPSSNKKKSVFKGRSDKRKFPQRKVSWNLMKKIQKTSLLFLITLLSFGQIPSKANALDKFFQSLGGQVNTSSPGAYHDQAAGYYTGGGYVMRQANGGVQPINLSLPKLGVGCNNLDMYFGSFSFIGKSEMVKLLRQIGSGTATYAFQLALKTMTPQIENTLVAIRKQMQDANSLMLNSCQMGQQIVGGLWPKGTAASEQICMDNQRGDNEDWFGAKDHCKKADAMNSGVQSASVKHKDLIVGEYNLVWHVLKKMDGYSNNKDLAYFVMSVTGTLLSVKDGSGYRLRVIEPRADQKDFIGAYLKGGTTTQLECDETDKCLAPKVKQVTISESMDSKTPHMKAKVLQKITELRTKYMTKENITEEELSFLNDAVNLPVYRYIQVSVAAGSTFLMQDSAEYIAAMVLLTQFDRVMSEVIEAVDALQKIQLEDTAISDFKKNLQSARARVQALLIGANAGSISSLNATIRSIEQSIIAKNS